MKQSIIHSLLLQEAFKDQDSLGDGNVKQHHAAFLRGWWAGSLHEAGVSGPLRVPVAGLQKAVCFFLEAMINGSMNPLSKPRAGQIPCETDYWSNPVGQVLNFYIYLKHLHFCVFALHSGDVSWKNHIMLLNFS